MKKFFYLYSVLLLVFWACTDNPVGVSPQKIDDQTVDLASSLERWMFAEFLQEVDSLSDPQAKSFRDQPHDDRRKKEAGKAQHSSLADRLGA